jgi:heptosyltransferase-2/heptosyltransferase-3
VGKELLTRAGIPYGYLCDSTAFSWLPEEGFADRYIRLGNYTPPAFEGMLPPGRLDSPRAASIHLTSTDRATAELWLSQRRLLGRPFIVVHPGNRHLTRRWLRSRSGVSKYWPEERWAQVIGALRDLRPDYAILMTGTAAEYGLNADVARIAGISDIHNVAGQMTLRTLLPLLERAHSVISVDTGPAHAAAALGRPTVALFGTGSARLYRPGGATTPAIALIGQIGGHQNILGISVQSVVSAWTDLVGSSELQSMSFVKSVTCD